MTQIRVNDKPIQLDQPTQIQQLLEQLQRPLASTAVAINQQIIPREQWTTIALQEGDDIAVFQAIAGG